MAAYYGSIHIRTGDIAAVLKWVRKIAKVEGCEFYVGGVTNGWISIFPSNHGLATHISQAIAKEAPDIVVHVIVMDMLLCVLCYYGGNVVTSYLSNPENIPFPAPIVNTKYEKPAEDQERCIGIIRRFSEQGALTGVQATFAAINGLGKELGITNILGAYEYIAEEADIAHDFSKLQHIAYQRKTRTTQTNREFLLYEETHKANDNAGDPIRAHVTTIPDAAFCICWSGVIDIARRSSATIMDVPSGHYVETMALSLDAASLAVSIARLSRSLARDVEPRTLQIWDFARLLERAKWTSV